MVEILFKYLLGIGIIVGVGYQLYINYWRKTIETEYYKTADLLRWKILRKKSVIVAVGPEGLQIGMTLYSYDSLHIETFSLLGLFKIGITVVPTEGRVIHLAVKNRNAFLHAIEKNKQLNRNK